MHDHRKRGVVKRAGGPFNYLSFSNYPPLSFQKGEVQVRKYSSIWKFHQNVRSIEGEGFYFGFLSAP